MEETERPDSWREKANSAWDDADYRDEAWLREKYAVEELSGNEIGEICGVSPDTIYKWLKKFDINRRDRNHGRRNWIDPSDELIESIEGGLLGDGYLGKPNENGGVYYQEVDKHREYCEWLGSYYADLGLEGNVAPRGSSAGTVWRFTSTKAMDLTNLLEKWYPDGEKSIPDDFEITPTKLLFWYVGDGFLSESHGKPTIGISGFDLADGFDRVVEQLKDEAITCSVSKQGIRIWLESHDDFFDYLSKSGVGIPDGYEYKFNRDREEVDADDYGGDGTA